MGALVAKAMRPIRSFNIENRARRVISKEKPTPAPTYAKNLEDLKRTLEADPNIIEKMNTKDAGLDTRLRDVYVTAMGKPEDDITREKQTMNPDRPLPESRTQPPNYEFGFKEPERITYGKTTIRHVLDFISAHQTNPDEITSEKIASQYKMNTDDVQNVLKYFKTFELYLPKTKTTAAVFAGPGTSRKQLEETELNAIGKNEQSQETEKLSRTDYETELKNITGTPSSVREQKVSILKK